MSVSYSGSNNIFCEQKLCLIIAGQSGQTAPRTSSVITHLFLTVVLTDVVTAAAFLHHVEKLRRC